MMKKSYCNVLSLLRDNKEYPPFRIAFDIVGERAMENTRISLMKRALFALFPYTARLRTARTCQFPALVLLVWR